MKSLVLTSLLAGSLFFISGCFGTDDVKDALGVKENVVYMVNGYATESITGTVEGSDKNLTAGALDAFTNIKDTLNVSYTVSGEARGAVSLATDKVHAYVAVECGGLEYLTHSIDSSHLVQVTNLGGTTITNGEYTISIGGVEALGASDSAAPCSTTALGVTSTTGVVVVTRVSDGETVSETLEQNYAFDVVVLSNGDVRIIPLLGFDDAASLL